MLRNLILATLIVLVYTVAVGPRVAAGGPLGCDETCSHPPGMPGYYDDIDLCPADLDDDEQVGSSDLSALLGCWGPADTEGACTAADFDQDQAVGCFDSEYLLGNWGACTGADLDGDGVVGESDLEILCNTLGSDCRFDLDHNGIVDENDQEALFCLWGTSAPQGDFDLDGTVGTADLTRLLSAYGRDCRADLDRDGWVDPCWDLEILLGKWPP